MEEDFELKETGSFFDFKGFLFKVISLWPLFILTLGVAYAVAYYNNVRKVPVYRSSNLISIKDDQNPLFTGNTSLIFNWGGTTDKVQTNIVLFKSRTHAEKAVQRLQFYTSYRKQGEYQLEDVYGKIPFVLKLQDGYPQLYGRGITIKQLDADQFEFNIPFNGGSMRLFDYGNLVASAVPAPKEAFRMVYTLGDTISTPFLRGILKPTGIAGNIGAVYLVSNGDFNGTVRSYRRIEVRQQPAGSSILELSLTGPNKFRLIDYLNASVVVREKDQLERKNLFATNTIRFIDSSLVSRGVDLEDALQELNRFKNNNLDVSLEGGLELLSGRLKSFDNQKDGAAKKLEYYEILEGYLTTRKDYSSVPAPSVAGISESSISGGVSRIVALSVRRSTYAFSAREDNPIFAELDRNINAEKVVLLENIRSSKSLIDREMQQIDADIREAERELKKYPAEEQKLTEIERKFSLSQAAFNLYEAKRSEAEIIKASNVSDLLFIDPAKDVGVGPIGPNMRLNYMMAALIGGVIPIALAFLIVFFDTKIGNPEEIKKLSQIPVLGVVGKSKHNNNLIVRDQPKSAISEAFRGIRSGLQFLYKTKKLEGAKTVLVTSSVSGEGKTFTSINIASVFALSGKKTVLVGLDLRKPKIFDDFELTNDMGVVNYLIGQSTLSEIRQDSGISHLDIILAGPIPPNPSELLISDRMKMFMDELKANYDYIILDTPPVGLVSDALEVLPYADATIYMVRQGYTKKNMLGLINEKYRNGEVKNVSFVLNYFRTKGRYGYGSGYGYGYGYGNYSNGYHEEQRSGGVLKKMSRKFRSLFRYKK